MFHKQADMQRRRLEIIVITVVIIGIIGYAGVGLVVAATRVAGAERTLNSVVSHQNTLNSTFSDLNTQLNALSSSSAFNPQQAIVLVDRSVSNSQLATKTINDDEASLNSASSQLTSTPWLTFVERPSIDRETARINHAHNALVAARTIASDELADGHFWHSLYAGLADLTTLMSQSGANDLTSAKTTLGVMKTDVDQAAQLSTAPGLPKALHDLMTDMQTFVADYGKQLDAKLAGDDAGVASYQNSIVADLQKIGGYDFDRIGAEITSYYKPLIDRFNTEIARATS